MKPGDSHELLDTILEETKSHAPSVDNVLVDLRNEKRARANRRMMAGTVGSVLLVVLFLSRGAAIHKPVQDQVVVPAPTTNVAAATSESDPSVGSDSSDRSPEPASEWKVARINDQQLLDMLADAPVALAQHPNGDRRLMMVVSAED